MVNTFKTFLLENTIKDGEAMSIPELVEFAKKNCSDFIKSNGNSFMFKGWKKDRKSGLYSPSATERKSANTSNFYTRLLDTNPANKDWPLRSRSFICSTSISTASGYSNGGDSLTMIIPVNGTKVGVVGQNDIWSVAFDFHFLGVKAFIQDVNEALGSLGLKAENMTYADINIHTFSKFPIKKIRLVFNECFETGPTLPSKIRKVNEMEDDEYLTALVKSLKEVYTYKMNNGFELVTKGPNIRDSETWFSGDCLVINASDGEEFVKLLNNS